MTNTNLLYLTFGQAKATHWQACFSILSFLAKGWRHGEIVVVTDAPANYAFLSGKVRLLEVDERQLTEWRGVTNNFFRPKIKALEACIAQSGEAAWLYLDSDTFLYNDPVALAHSLAQGHYLLHLQEGQLAELKSKSLRQLYQRTRGRQLAGVPVPEGAAMWNAGVIGLPAKDAAAAIQKVLAVCDTLCAEGLRPRLLEQFSFSVTLPSLGTVLPADGCIGHYWSNKMEWEQAIAAFFANALLEGDDLEGILTKMRAFDFRKIPIARKVRKTRLRLVAAVGSVFGDRVGYLEG